jgi:GntR family transcriptional regulator
MRFWITKNSELSVRDQIVNQIMLGVLSEDLPAGHRLPSVRALARRHRIHSNTVSSAYHELVEQGWLELRRGSGLYVSARPPSSTAASELDRMLTKLLQAGALLGYRPDDILCRLENLVRPRTYKRLIIAEPDCAMYEILCCEIAEHIAIPIERGDESVALSEQSLVVALPGRVSKVQSWLPQGVRCFPLRLRSVTGAMERESPPGRDALIAIASRSSEIRHWARAMLISAGLDVEVLCDIDSSQADWAARTTGTALVVTDLVSARESGGRVPTKVFRVIADSSIAELLGLIRT